jgi:hypothetical protein
MQELREMADPWKEWEIEILVLMDNWQMTTGRKHAELLRMAQGKWVVWVHDDDRLSADYFVVLMPMAAKDPPIDVFGYPMVVKRRVRDSIYREEVLTAGKAATAKPFARAERFPGLYCLWRRDFVAQFLDEWPDETPHDSILYPMFQEKIGESMELQRPEYLYDCTGKREAAKHYTPGGFSHRSKPRK